MLLSDDSLERDMQDLVGKLREPTTLNPANSDPIFYFVYRPGHMLAVKHRLVGWIGLMRNAGLEPVRISLAGIKDDLIEESGRWATWVELEPEQDDPQALNRSIQGVLTQNDALVERVRERLKVDGPNTVFLLTEAELLHPYFRTRAIETQLVGHISHPVVIFYPGRRVGQYGLRFLGFYPEDPNYRSTLIGGLE